MPENDIELVSKEWLQTELRSINKNLIILDCRSTNEFQEGHIRSAVNFSIPSIMLRRLAAGKIDIISTIKCRDLKQRIQSAYNNSVFVLYNDYPSSLQQSSIAVAPADTSTDFQLTNQMQGNAASNCGTDATNIINVLHRRLKQDGCRTVWLEDGFSGFRDAFPEWCDDDSTNKDVQMHRTNAPTEQLMGLRSLRISTPHSDSACSSSAESSDCETSTHPQMSEEPVQILPFLYLGNEAHSKDIRSLQKYNIRYVLNVTPDLPNVFEGTGTIRYLQIPIKDHYSQDLAQHFPAAINFIDEARHSESSVLVHCLAGVSRSVTVTLAYLMHTRSLCLNDAFSLVRARKHDVSPNFNFMQQLKSFENQIKSNPNRTPLSGLSCDSSYLTPDLEKYVRPSKYSCGCMEVECKCMQIMQTEYLGTGIGVSPDSGIEFDRWTPAGGTPK